MIRRGERWPDTGGLRNRNHLLAYEERTRASQSGGASRRSAITIVCRPWHPEKDSPMIETQTRKPIHVSTDGAARPYIMVPVDQLGFVRTLLDRHDKS
jgi:hypothetical protein